MNGACVPFQSHMHTCFLLFWYKGKISWEGGEQEEKSLLVLDDKAKSKYYCRSSECHFIVMLPMAQLWKFSIQFPH